MKPLCSMLFPNEPSPRDARSILRFPMETRPSEIAHEFCGDAVLPDVVLRRSGTYPVACFAGNKGEKRQTNAGRNSEPEDGTKGDSQVVVPAVVKVDLVAQFETQPHRTQTCLHPSSRIDCRV